MGFPIGEQDIVFVEMTNVIKSLANNLTRAKHCYQVTPSDLCKAITANQAADEEFKLNFIVLLSNALNRIRYSENSIKNRVSYVYVLFVQA